MRAEESSQSETDRPLAPLEKKLNDILFTLSHPAVDAVSERGWDEGVTPLPAGDWDHTPHVNAYDSGSSSLTADECEGSESLPDTEALEGETSDPEDLTVTGPSGLDTEDPAGTAWGPLMEQQHWPRYVVAALAKGENAYDKPKEPLIEAIRKAQSVDSFVAEHRHEPRSNRPQTDPWQFGSGGILRFKGRAYVPPDAALRQEILKINHDDPHSSHFGARKTLHLLQRHYHWPSIAADVKDYVQTCTTCQRTKTARHLPYGQLASLPQPKGPWQEISMDFITDLPPSFEVGTKSIRDSILVVVDRYTKVAVYIPTVKTCDAVTLAGLFLEKVVRLYGVPVGIVSDRGGQFTSKFWSALCFYLRVERRLSTAFHPQTDGQTERQNQTVEHYLRCYCNYRQDDWCSKLALAEFTYNNSVHATTQVTPYYALYGFQPEIRINPERDNLPEVPGAKLRVKQIEDERAALSERWRNAVAAQQKFHNKRHLPIACKIGDQVMLSARNIRQLRPSKKLADRQLGTFKVVAIMGAHKQAYKLELPPTWAIHPVFHVSLLEPYRHRPGSDVEPTSVDIDPLDGEQYDVEAILADRTRRGVKEYLIRWKDYPPEADSWEPESNLSAPDLLKEYETSLESAPPAKKRRTRRS